MIPLLPPLVEFMDPASLCHYSGTSKMLRKEVRDTKAWALLARAQLKPRDEASEALSQVKSHVRRRLLADALSQDTPPALAFRPNTLQDFTFFVRFEEDGRKIWEGDLKAQPGPQVWVDYSESAWFDLGPVGWTYMVRPGIKFTIVAIRDEDNAMVSLGQFNSKNCDSIVGSDDETEVEYSFQSSTALFSSARFSLRLSATLVMVYNEVEGRDSVSALSFRLEHHSEYAVDNNDYRTLAYNPDGHVDTFSKSQLEYLLSYLAGIHHLARASALATIESWHVDALRYIIQQFEELRDLA